MTRRLISLTLALCLLCSAALADWYCPDANCPNHNHALQDRLDFCDECGAAAPIHGLAVTLSGENMLRMQWQGYMVNQVDLFYSISGQQNWFYAGSTDRKTFVLNNLQSGTSYDLLLSDWNAQSYVITAKTKSTVKITPTPKPTKTPTPRPTKTPTPKPTRTPTPKPTATPQYTPVSNSSKEFTSRYYSYTVLRDNTLNIVNYQGNPSVLIIPEKLQGRTISTISQSAFTGISMSSVTLPKGLTTINGNPFVQCDKLMTITVPKGNTGFTVVNNALIETQHKVLICYPSGRNAAGFTFPQDIKAIGNDAFNCCPTLTSALLPYGVTKIGNGAFSMCDNLTTVSLPYTLTSLGKEAFAFCFNLKNVSMPNSVTEIGDYAFYSCGSLSSVALPSGLKKIKTGTFGYCSSLRQITIPAGVTFIADDAFEGCDNLTLVVKVNSYAYNYARSHNMKYSLK